MSRRNLSSVSGRNRWPVPLVVGILLLGWAISLWWPESEEGSGPPSSQPSSSKKADDSPHLSGVQATQVDRIDPAAGAGRPSSQDLTNAHFQLRPLTGNRFESPAGLIYGPTANEHRIDHVLRHARDDPTRPQAHGVFNRSARDEVLALIDEAYRRAQADDPDVTTRQEGDRTIHTVDMHRQIGYVGGRAGQSRNHPPCSRMVLVLEERNVITAYPVE